MEDEIEQIIIKYCGAVEERIAACRDRKVAKYLKQSIYNEIKQNCESKSVFDIVKQYVDHLIEVKFQSPTWPGKKENSKNSARGVEIPQK
jgi:hypothetical protein